MASTIKVDEIEGSTGSTVTVPTGQTFTVTDGIAIGSLPTITAVKGGTGQTGFAAGDLLYANSTTTLAKLTKPGSTQVLQMTSGGTPSWVDAGGGGLLQIKQTVVTAATASSTTSSLADIAGMTVDITPTLSTSKILVLSTVNTGITPINYSTTLSLMRDSTQIFMGDAADARTRGYWGGNMHKINLQYNTQVTYIDAPATTSATTYKIQWYIESGATIYLNRSAQDGTDLNNTRSASSITVMELAVGVL